MGFSLWKCVTTLTTFFVSCTQISNVHGSAIMSVDIGTEWIKVTTVLPSEPVGTAGNQSVRKHPNAVAIRKNGREFGKDALNLGISSPSNCYAYFLDLLGKKIDNPVVELYKKRFPQHEIVPHPEKNTVLFKHSDLDMMFSPEELVAMILEEARDFEKDISKEDINEAVISVPGYFGQAERSAILKAAEIAGIKVLQLINSYTAAALNYGTLHSESFSEASPVYIMFYDMGAYGTQASIVSYQLVNSKGTIVPELTVLGVGYERNLGGLEIQLRLRDYLALRFNNLRLTPNDVTKNPKSMVRLFEEAGKLKDALSASTDHLLHILNLIDKKDMVSKVSRGTLEELCEDLFDKVVLPAQRALESSGLTIEHIQQVILIGNGAKVPRVQDRLVKDLKIGQSLGRLLNSDETVVLGTAYKAAGLSKGFKVKQFITKDATIFPIQVIYNEEIVDENKPAKQVKRILFNRMSTYPQRKIMTFNKHQKDFDFTVAYAELNHLDENEVRCLGSLLLKNIKLNGVKNAYSKHQGQEEVDIKGIEVHFRMDDSGLLVLLNAELIVKKTAGDDEITVTDSNENLEVITIKEKIDVEHEYLFVPPVQGDDLQSSINKLKELKQIDINKKRREKSLNILLAGIFEVQSRITTPHYDSVATDTEKKMISHKCLGISSWLGYGNMDSEPEEYDSKFEDLKNLVMPVWTRASEHLKRPKKLKALNNTLSSISLFLKEIKNKAEEDIPYTPSEMETLEKLISEVIEWRDKKVEEQEKLPQNVDPVLKVEVIEIIHETLEHQMNKFPSWKSKKAQTGDEEADTSKEEDRSVFKINLRQNETENPIANEKSNAEENNADLNKQPKTEESQPEKPETPAKTEKQGNKNTEL